ncbi:MAG: beta-ketoacyl synthase N-terminal-like domain-containing protein [Gammaproteobacteria bacterium]|nr:beta-ketoacyl synthase N-terminal-like domain-containing protein [Gammaproteobacteria bacterium]
MTETQNTLQKALFTIKKLKHLVLQQQSQSFEPVAIVGLSCRYPQAIGKEGYWRMLSEGRNVLSRIPQERWDLLKGTDQIALRDEAFPYFGGYMSDIANFDAYFFGISPREAVRMDPQHRLLLEVAYEAFEDAGMSVESLAGSKTGVFSSLFVSQLAHMQTMDDDLDALYLPTGNAISIAANRISYLFDLRGPSVIVDSACSSSMVSLQLACLNLQSKACDTALVCGAKLNVLPYVNYVLAKAKMLSPDGQCKTFDADANGYAQGEGVGAVILKPLSKALHDKDRIYGVITGCAVNQDGKTNGLTAPNGLQQEAMLKAAYQSANVDPTDISYVECHGTGTFLGDPIEVEALGEVVSKGRDKAKPCWIASVKTNIGHLEPAAGISSIIKVALALKHGQIPPHLNFTSPNPHINFDKYQFKIPREMQEWPKYGEYRMAGVSGFGFGGTNAHIVMRELSESEKPIASPLDISRPEIFTISAKDPSALSLLLDRWCETLTNNPNMDLAQLCYNTHLRRSHYFYRLAIVATTTTELLDALKSLKSNPVSNDKTIFINISKDKVAKKSLEPVNLVDIDAKNLASLYVTHANISWAKYEEGRSYPHMDMPLYPWQYKQYWPPLGQVEGYSQDIDLTYPLRARQLASPLHFLQFEFNLDSKLIPDIEDTYNILHAGYYMEIFSFAVNSLSQQPSFTIEEHQFLSPLIIPASTILKVQLTLSKLDDGRFAFQFFSHSDGQKNWVEHAKGKMTLHASPDKKSRSIKSIQGECPKHEQAESLYTKVIAMGMPAGESIRWTQQFWRNDKEILCEFKQPKFEEKNGVYSLKVHPSIIDACIQPLFKLLPENSTTPYIASSAERIRFYGMKKGPVYLHGILREVTGEKMIGDCYLLTENGEYIAEFENICLTQLDNKIQIEQIMQAKSQFNMDFSALPPAERKKRILDFLVEQIATIFSMPKQDVEVNRSLRDMGIDSLMALVLMRTLEVALGASYPMHDLLEGPTIAELADFVVNTTEGAMDASIASKTKSASLWIAYRKPQPKVKVRVFCFPYGGGGASIYRDWQRDLPDTIELCPIQLPGRENRMNETPIGDIKILVDELIDSLLPELNVPFAFFGHSFGSLVAFELARTLRQRNLPMPIHLFVSAFPDPRVPAKSLDNLLKQSAAVGLDLFELNTESAITKLSDEKLKQISDIFGENGVAEYGDHLMNRDIIKVLLPIFIGDMGIVKSYEYDDAEPLDLPITVFLGKRDTWVAYEDHLRWVDHTNRTCEIHKFDSGHLFIKDNLIKQVILNEIARALVADLRVPVFSD